MIARVVHLRPTPTPTPTPTATPTPEPTVVPTPTPETENLDVIVTYYGWPDNDPPGTAIAYPVIHSGAGGTGTYEDPITFAARNGQFDVGQILYVPYIKKYVIREDLCASCTYNWIDIWMNSTSRYSWRVRRCEEQWTKWKGEEVPVELNPPADREVDTTPLFNPGTGQCLDSI